MLLYAKLALGGSHINDLLLLLYKGLGLADMLLWLPHRRESLFNEDRMILLVCASYLVIILGYRRSIDLYNCRIFQFALSY